MCLETVDFTKLDREGQPVRIRLGATVADVRHEGDGVRVSYAVEGRLYTRTRTIGGDVRRVDDLARPFPICRKTIALPTSSSTACLASS